MERTDHLACKDTVELVVVQAGHPLKVPKRVILECAADEDARLRRDLLLDRMRHSIVAMLVLVLRCCLELLHAKGRLARKTTWVGSMAERLRGTPSQQAGSPLSMASALTAAAGARLAGRRTST